MQIIDKSIDELIPYCNNSRTHDESQILQIASSIKEFGFTNPVLIDEDNGIIAGHGRVLAARKLGIDKVPSIKLSHLTDIQKKAYIIADNKIALNAGWDEELLKNEVEQLIVNDFDIDLIGFSDEEIDSLLGEEEEASHGLADKDSVPEVPEDPITKPGDVWIMGEHRLMCGDGTSVDDVGVLMNGEMADLFLTDPPYNVDYSGGTKDRLKIENDSMSNDDFRKFLTDAFVCAWTFMRSGAAFYIWHSETFGLYFRLALQDAGFRLRQCLIWNKSCMVMGRSDYHWKHEPCLYGWKDGDSHFWNSDRKQVTVLDFEKPARNGSHPTMKPVELFEYLIKNSTKSGWVVVDLFGGSGTTLIASEINKRKSMIMEISPVYCDVIIKRWQEYVGDSAILESSGQTFNSYIK